MAEDNPDPNKKQKPLTYAGKFSKPSIIMSRDVSSDAD
jgi:hypothetical protein